MKSFLAILCLVLLSGCSTISGWRDAAALKAGYTSKARAESLLGQVKKEADAKLAAKDRDIADKQAEWARQVDVTQLFVAGRLYRIDLTYQLTPHPDRSHTIMDNNANEARAVLPPPPVQDMIEANVEIKRQLDETKTSLEQLKTEHEATLKQAAMVRAQAEKAETELAAAKIARTELQLANDKAVAAKQVALDKVNDSVITAERARGDDATARHALMTKLSMGAGLLAALCLAGAIWSPVFKTQFGLASVTLGVAAVGIWYLTPLVVLSIVGTGVLGVAAWAALNHNTSTKTTAALVNAVQDVKEKAPEVYAASVKPALEDWTTKYTKVDGQTVAVPDKAVTKTIDAQLVTSNRV